MRICLDFRPLLDERRSGVGNYTAGLLTALARRPGTRDLEYVRWANSLKAPAPSDLSDGPAPRLTRWPNRLLNATMSIAGWPKIEGLCGGADLIYLPNLNFLATDRPYIVTVHDLSFTRFPQFFSPKQRLWHAAIRPGRLLRRAAAVVAVSEHTKEDIAESYGIAPQKIAVVPPAAGPEFAPAPEAAISSVRLRYGLPPRYFLCVGTIEPRKNLMAAIRSFAALGPSEAVLAVVGGSGYRAATVRAAAAASSATERIRFLDRVPSADLPALYSGAVALVYPSFYEGFGMPPLEAMACGTPVIASHISSLSEVVGDAGLLVDPYRDGDIIDAMSALQQDARLRQTLIERGSERARRFSWEKSAALLESLFRKTALG